MRNVSGTLPRVRARIAAGVAVTWMALGACREHRLPAEELVDFRTDIQPLLAERCAACHGA
ncbi:MAG: hypothetical protein EOO74_04660, partial [Myxococcales bacterium]